MATATFTGTREELRALLQRLPGMLAGRLPDPYGVARLLQLRLGVALLSLIQQSFILKSRSETGTDGIKWKPLTPATIAARRAGPGDWKAITLKARAPGLSPAEKRRIEKDIRWRQAQLMFRYGMGAKEAAGLARATAEGAARRAGASIATKYGILSTREVDIGRDTNVLFNSLAAGVDDRPSGEADQIFETPPGRVIVGSKVTYFEHFHHARPVWPLDNKLPDEWNRRLVETLKTGVVRVVALLMSRGAKS